MSMIRWLILQLLDTRKISDHNITKIEWAQSARRHRIGRTSALFVMCSSDCLVRVEENDQRTEVWFLGTDERGRELEILALAHEGTLFVIHVMPRGFRRNDAN